MRHLGLLALCITVLTSTSAFATTFYVDYAKGSDSNNGIAKTSPWKHAPGMNGASGSASSTAVRAGDSVILKGCVTWPNAAFSWSFPYAGTNGNPIYVGVDKTWWDSSVTGCTSAWNRPVLNLGNAAPTDSFYRIILLLESYVTYDNFEVTNVACLPSPNGQTNIFDWGDGSSSGITVQNMYIHGWNNPYFSVGTGNIASGATTVTNYVPYSYSTKLPTAAWASSGEVKLQSFAGKIPYGNNTPVVTGVSGTNPYTITFTNTAGGASQACTGCVFQVGGDFCRISGGVEAAQTDDVMQDNVIDGSDTAEVQLNPSGDCGLSEGNNNFCVASGFAGWRLPNIWRDNVIRFVDNVFIGECTEWSGNLLEYIRLGTDPTGHTNAVECADNNPVNNATYFYGNTMRHMTNPNPNTPGGRWSIGLGAIMSAPRAGETSYAFNNVFHDILQNATFERGSSTGKWKIFNNTSDCGPSWSLAYPCVASLIAGDLVQNNHFITSSSTPLGNCSGYTCTTNVTQSPTAASGQGYTPSEDYAYSPTSSGGSTVETGTVLSSLCTAIGSANSAAGTACQNDTPYAVTYDSTNHVVVVPARKSLSRPGQQTAWDVGAYQFNGGSQVDPPTHLQAVVN